MARSSGNTITALEANLREINQLIKNLNEEKKKLTDFGGSAEEIRKITAQVKELEKITKSIGFDRRTNSLSAKASSGSTATSRAADIKRTYEAITKAVNSYERAVNKAEDSQIRFNKKVEELKQKYSLWAYKNKEGLTSSEGAGVNSQFQSLMGSLNAAKTVEDLDKVKARFEYIKVDLDEVYRLQKRNHQEQEEALRKEEELRRIEQQQLLANVEIVGRYAATIKAKIIDGIWKSALNLIKNVIDATKTLDAELVEIRKVTDFSEAELSAFIKNIQEIGNRTATTTSQLLEATAVFARSGYTKEQIASLTEEAAVLKNVSDGITDMSKAAETLISVMKAYHVEAENARSITDTLNAISNKSAISFDDLAEGLSRVGSVFASQDTSIAQLSAMLTGANEILQNIEKTSTGLKTISQRLRGISNETDEEGVNLAKLQGIVSDITSKYGEAVRITDEHTGQLRGTYDIISDLAKVWGQMSKNEQQLLGEKIAGKTQITVLQALLNNWESVENAIKNADNAAGSAAREQQAYINSLTGALEQLKATIENIYANITDSQVLSMLVTMANLIIKITDKLIGVNPIILGLLGAGITGKIQKMVFAFRYFSGSLTSIFGEGGIVSLLKNAVKYSGMLNTTTSALISKMQLGANINKDNVKSLVSMLSVQSTSNGLMMQRIGLQQASLAADKEELRVAGEIVAVQQIGQAVRAAAIGLTILGIAAIVRGIIKAREAALAAANESYSEYESKLEDIKSKIKEIHDEIESAGGQTTQNQIDKLKELNAELEITAKLAEQAKKRLIEQTAASAKKYVGARYVKSEALGWDFTVSEYDISQFLDEQGNLIKEKYYEAYEYVKGQTAEAVKTLAKETSDIWWDERYADFIKLENLVDQETERLNKIITLGLTKDSLTSFLALQFKDMNWKEIANAIDESDVEKTLYYKIFPNTSRTIEERVKNWADMANRMWSFVGDDVGTWQKTYDAVWAVDRALSDYVDLYSKAGALSSSEILTVLENWEKYADVLTVDVNGNLAISKELVVARAKAELLTIKDTLLAKKTQLETEILLEKATLKTTQQALINAKKQVQSNNKVNESLYKTAKLQEAVTSLYKGMDVDVDAVTLDTKRFQTRIDDLNVSIANQEEALKNITAQIEAIDKIDLDKLLARAASSTKSATKATEELNEELTKLKDILSVLKQEMTDTTDVYQKVQAAMKDIVQAEIDAIEAENDLLDENMKYYKARITLIEEYYESGIDELKKQRDAAVEANEAEQQALEDKIDALKEATDEYEKQNEAAQDAIDEQVKALEAQIDALDEANNAREKEIEMQERLLNIEKARLAMEKAKDAYEAAKASKTVRTYDAQRGWIYTADQSAVASAYSEYQSAQKSYQDLLDELAKAQAEAELQAQKDAIQAQIDELKEQKETLKEQLEQTKEDAEKQESDWESEIDLLKAQKDEIKEKFEAQIDELEKQSDSISNIEDDVDRLLDRYLNDEDVIAWAEAYKNASEEERAAMEAELKARWGADKTSQAENEARIADLKSLIKDIEGMLETTEDILESEGVKAWLASFTAGDLSDKNSMVAEMKRAYQEFYTNQKAEIDKVQAAIDKLEGTLTTTNSILAANWGTGKENTPVNSYASGGVVDSGLLMNTGMLSNRVKVHGTPSSPELILNGRQQANLLYRLGQQKPSVVTNNSPSASNSMYIATLNIQADSQDTLYGLLLQAKQLATIS